MKNIYYQFIVKNSSVVNKSTLVMDLESANILVIPLRNQIRNNIFWDSFYRKFERRIKHDTNKST